MKLSATSRHAILIASMIASVALPAGVHAQPKNYLIKASGPTVYFNADDGKRYAFPNESIFKSWYPNFISVAQISDETLASLQLGGNVTYRPGSTLIKITTDPRVYAVSRYGTLHWLKTEEVAKELYGADWNTKVRDVPDTYFTNYRMSYEIDVASKYSPSGELTAAPTIQENMAPVSYVPPVSAPVPVVPQVNAPVVTVELSASQAVLNQNIFVNANVKGSILPISRIDIYSSASPNILATCLNTTNCTYTFTVATAPFSAHYSAVAKDSAGGVFPISTGRPLLTVLSSSDQIQMSVTPMTVVVGSRASFSSNLNGTVVASSTISNSISVGTHKVYALVPGEPLPVLWKNCGAVSYCSGSTPFYRTTYLYSQVESGGQTLVSSPVKVEVVGGEPPKAKIAVAGYPGKNQVSLNVSAPNGEMITTTSIVDGTSIDDKILALCDADCSIILQIYVPGSVTAFTWVAGKYEQSNTITVKPE